MGRRTKARECALQMLYQWEITREPMDKVAESFWRVRTTTDETRARAERLARGAQEQVATIDGAIASVSAHWLLERLAAVDLCILRLGTYELMMERSTPPAVILDEAVEIAKRFGEAETPAFVNGILDAIMRQVRGGLPPAEAGAKVKERP